jgi:CRP-like cAMP-binding protein
LFLPEGSQEPFVADVASPGRHGNRLLASLPQDALEAMRSELQNSSPERGRVLIEAGDDITNVYFPQTGMISLLIVTKDGDTVETSTIGFEGSFGIHSAFGPRRSLTRATVQIPGQFWSIKASRFGTISRDYPAIRSMAARYTEILWAEAQQVSACNAVHDAMARLSRWLLQSADRVGRDELPLTQEFLAQMLGVRRTTVTLLAQTLQSKGLVRYSRGKIVIVDRRALEDCACECYDVLRPDALTSNLRIDLGHENDSDG